MYLTIWILYVTSYNILLEAKAMQYYQLKDFTIACNSFHVHVMAKVIALKN